MFGPIFLQVLNIVGEEVNMFTAMYILYGAPRGPTVKFSLFLKHSNIVKQYNNYCFLRKVLYVYTLLKFSNNG